MINEIINTICYVDRKFDISKTVKNTIQIVKDFQPIIITGFGYYSYYKIIRIFI